jgi:hypothetical protein
MEFMDRRGAKALREAWRALVPAAVVVGALIVSGWTAGAQGKVDVTGKWMLEVNTEAGGTTTPSVTLKQDGEKLTGRYSSATLGDADVTGTIKGQNITFSLTGNAQGQSIQVTYTGTVEGSSMKGKIDLAGVGGGTFTGKKQ